MHTYIMLGYEKQWWLMTRMNQDDVYARTHVRICSCRNHTATHNTPIMIHKDQANVYACMHVHARITQLLTTRQVTV
jgi:hypothetical protein